ncbi:MAG TPA: HAMP domain-containing sensor histidine kinase [Methylomirabilota bacterium]|nr:HAMP domain-containing sensor histidine kinase [Methylomirabilota bacterium]
MKKVALVFVLAVFAPSLVLAWLAVRSARDQQIVVAQQQTLLYQGVADALAKEVRDFMAEQQREFAQFVERQRAAHSSADLARQFDGLCVKGCPSAEVGFTVSGGEILSPSLFDRPEARQFRLNNDRFLGSCESVEVYWNSPKDAVAIGKSDLKAPSGIGLKYRLNKNDMAISTNLVVVKEVSNSGVVPEEAEFRELVGNSYEGIIARFLQNRLKILLWYRTVGEPDLIYGAQLNLTNIIAGLQPLVRPPESVGADAAVGLINDAGKIVAGAVAAGRKPFVSSEIGHVLPHWKVAVYLNHPKALTRSARTVKLVLTWSVLAMIVAIGLGGALIVVDLKQQLALARQKTDFVSNVSHELKTPLTSIRMFTELLSEGKIANDNQRQQFLQIIGSETARLTRLINNVLDFARMERGEKEYKLTRCDLRQVVRETVELYRPQLEASGFSVTVTLPDSAVEVNGDCDALAQVLVNLLSNAEKYAPSGKELSVQLSAPNAAARSTELRVLDRGPGVARDSEEKIFEQFYRAHDALSSGIQGSGLGLTLARQIARAHGGDLRYESREGGGSCFVATVPMTAS